MGKHEQVEEFSAEKRKIIVEWKHGPRFSRAAVKLEEVLISVWTFVCLKQRVQQSGICVKKQANGLHRHDPKSVEK